jgi:hypothetical protein
MASIRGAQLPRLKILDEFDFATTPRLPAAKTRSGTESLHRTERAHRFDRRLPHGQEPPGVSILFCGLPPEAARTVCDGRALINALMETSETVG